MNIGDKVTLKADSQWANPKEDYLKKSNPLGVIGTVIDVLPFDSDGMTIGVNWNTTYENGSPIVNTYSEEDLEVVV